MSPSASLVRRFSHGTVAAERVQREIERTPHPANPELLRQSRDRVENGRREVRVLVSVEVRGAHSGREDLPDLRSELVVRPDLAPRQRGEQLRNAGRQRLSA